MTTLQHYLRSLLAPSSVALVGATGRAGSVGRVVVENLLEGEFKGELHWVNPRHRRVLGRRSYPTLRAIGKPVELALIAVPCAAVTSVLDDGAHAGVRAAILLSAPPGDEDEARRWERDVMATARKRRVRLLGPHAFGVIRTDIGLNATMGAAVAHPGRLALIAQSGAVCTAMLNFATPLGIGFSTVVALGGGYDVGFGELLDALVRDTDTDGILLYVESIRDARSFVSALRAAARTKPVVVLRAGRSRDEKPTEPAAPTPDAVFEAALKRAGTVRVMTYTQLFAAARILAAGRIPGSDHLVIVTNGRGPGTLAADAAADRGVPLAVLAEDTQHALADILPEHMSCANPVNVRGDASPERFAGAVTTVLGDPNVDAVLALHVERPLAGAMDAARAVADVARGAKKPVLAAWLGSLERSPVREALEAGGVPNFYTPENAVEAFSFLATYRRNQAWLLEVPPPQPEPRPVELAAVERIRDAAASASRTLLTDLQTHRLLTAFGLPVPPADAADTLKEALAVARKLGFPVMLKLDAPGIPAKSPLPLARTGLRDGRMLTRAYGEMQDGVRRAFRRDDIHAGVIVRKERKLAASHEVAISVHTDTVFGPVITLGACAGVVERGQVVLLPPLNERLVVDGIRMSPASWLLGPDHAASTMAPVVTLLLQLSSLVVALPWVRTVVLDPVHVGGDTATIGGARVVIDPRRRAAATGYRHMAIHPYPIELAGDATLRDGTVLHVRPIRPEDAELELAFVNALSEQSRYFRFFYRLHELTPAMLARFTQVDYDREMALVAIDDGKGPRPMRTFVGVARYTANPDGESAEFAIVIADAWQGRGVGRLLMERLIDCARRRGLARLEGDVLRANVNMRRFSEGLGFVARDDPEEPEQVTMSLDLT